MYTYYPVPVNSCHGCGGKGWVSPSYGTAVVCPVCGGSGVARVSPPKPSTAVPGTPYIAPTPTYPAGKCPNAGHACFCTGACRVPNESWHEMMKDAMPWNTYVKDDDNNV